MSLATDAATALEAAAMAAETARQAAIDALEQAARDRLAALFTAPDGKVYDPKALSRLYLDLDAELVVLGDASAAVAVLEGKGEVRYAFADETGAWGWAGEPLTSLADLGRRLEGVAG